MPTEIEKNEIFAKKFLKIFSDTIRKSIYHKDMRREFVLLEIKLSGKMKYNFDLLMGFKTFDPEDIYFVPNLKEEKLLAYYEGESSGIMAIIFAIEFKNIEDIIKTIQKYAPSMYDDIWLNWNNPKYDLKGILT